MTDDNKTGDARLLLSKAELASACRQNDAAPNLDEVATACGIDVAGLMYVSEQRALRMVLGRTFGPGEVNVFRLSPQQRELLGKLQAMWVDGACAALRAREEGVKGSAS